MPIRVRPRLRTQIAWLVAWGDDRHRRRLVSALPLLEQAARRRRTRIAGRPSRTTELSDFFESGKRPPWPGHSNVEIYVRPNDITLSNTAGVSIRVSSRSVGRGEPAAVPNPFRAIDRPGLATSHGRRTLVIHSLPVRASWSFERLAARAARRMVLQLELEQVDHSTADGIVALAARGVPMWMPEAPRHEQLRAIAGNELCELLAVPVVDLAGRAERSVRLARITHAQHSPRARMAKLEERLGMRATSEPEISVLLSSRRPTMIAAAVDMVAQQCLDAQLVVGLHGSEWTGRHEREIRDRWTGPLQCMHFDDRSRLGGNLNELARRADGRLLTKWDDDDWYGRHHLLDLSQAHDWSGADIVGKAAEYVWLADHDVTVVRSAAGAQTYSHNLAGGTLMLSAATFEEVGGFSDVARSVDRLLIDRILDMGGSAYRTHGRGYVLRRDSSTEHTWSADSAYFLDDAVETHPGLAVDVAGIEADER